jgi:putative transposase
VEVVEERTVSIERACRILGLPRSMYYYKSRRDDSEVETKLRSLAERFPTKGFSDYYGRIRNEGIIWNHKRVKRIYVKLGLNIRRKVKRRLPKREKQPLESSVAMNKCWSMDFMSDSLESGRKIRILNVIDDFNREALNITVDSSLPGERVVRELKDVIDWRGKPEEIRVDNGPEFTSGAFVHFCESEKIKIKYIQPGKPAQNAFIERFNRTFRKDVLDAFVFSSIEQVKEIAEEWQQDYNTNHPHKSLKRKSPRNFLLHSIEGTLNTVKQPNIDEIN